jgi:hypothetical protein
MIFHLSNQTCEPRSPNKADAYHLRVSADHRIWHTTYATGSGASLESLKHHPRRLPMRPHGAGSTRCGIRAPHGGSEKTADIGISGMVLQSDEHIHSIKSQRPTNRGKSRGGPFVIAGLVPATTLRRARSPIFAPAATSPAMTAVTGTKRRCFCPSYVASGENINA